jgi:hypothetical protein
VYCAPVDCCQCRSTSPRHGNRTSPPACARTLTSTWSAPINHRRYRHGAATLLDYLNALQDYRQVNLSALNADMQVWLNLHQISFAAATEIVP